MSFQTFQKKVSKVYTVEKLDILIERDRQSVGRIYSTTSLWELIFFISDY